jgi:hypothetical protein
VSYYLDFAGSFLRENTGRGWLYKEESTAIEDFFDTDNFCLCGWPGGAGIPAGYGFVMGYA